MSRAVKNVAASIRQRLLNLSRERRENYDLILTRYGLERFLYRLANSEYAERFVLKGAMLIIILTETGHRPTKDLDLLGYGDHSAEALKALFQEVCRVEAEPDGITFAPDSVQVEDIRKDQEYQGKRVKLKGMLGQIPVNLQVDIGFGDVVVPEAREIEYPTLLELPAPRIRAYPKETVVAEKLQAMIALGMGNSRMKDFYDLWVMSGSSSLTEKPWPGPYRRRSIGDRRLFRRIRRWRSVRSSARTEISLLNGRPFSTARGCRITAKAWQV